MLGHVFYAWPPRPNKCHVTDLFCQNEAFVFHSGFAEEQLLPGHQLLVEKLAEAGFSRQYVCKKYANKKFLKASIFAIDWAKNHVSDLPPAETMMVED